MLPPLLQEARSEAVQQDCKHHRKLLNSLAYCRDQYSRSLRSLHSCHQLKTRQQGPSISFTNMISKAGQRDCLAVAVPDDDNHNVSEFDFFCGCKHGGLHAVALPKLSCELTSTGTARCRRCSGCYQQTNHCFQRSLCKVEHDGLSAAMSASTKLLASHIASALPKHKQVPCCSACDRCLAPPLSASRSVVAAAALTTIPSQPMLPLAVTSAGVCWTPEMIHD